LLLTIENLAGMLEVSPNTIIKWALSLGLDIKTDNSNLEHYSEESIHLFKDIKALILNGYTFAEIKEFLSVEIEYQNKIKKAEESIIVEETSSDGNNIKNNDDVFYSRHSEDVVDLVNEFSSFSETLNFNYTNQQDISALFNSLLKELKQYTERAIEAEKKVYLLEDYKQRAMLENLDLNSQIKQFKVQLEENEQKLKDYDEQKKRLNLMDVQLKIMQFENNKKKFWDFFK